ncbi:MAG TPA: 3'-5' exonuclease, partial [Promineifilum sp.]|nr:3'-5' exonuclease [Promineifilum sp.]
LLPIDQAVLTLAQDLFSEPGDLALAHKLAVSLEQIAQQKPDWRLPELVAQLQSVATGRRALNVVRDDAGYDPKPGRITLTTQHSAKGLEWDAVFLVGIDGMWIPGSLESPFLGVHDFLGGDPNAEATAQLSYLMRNEAGIYPNRTATESAHIEVICERLRLLYVGITRARRYLHLSRSRAGRRRNHEQETEPATVLGVLYRYVQER